MARMSNLKTITFNNNCVKDAPLFFKSLSKCSSLEVIELKSVIFSGGNFNIEIAEALTKWVNLKVINFAYSNLNDENVKALATPLASLTQLQKANFKSLSISVAAIEPTLAALMLKKSQV